MKITVNFTPLYYQGNMQVEILVDDILKASWQSSKPTGSQSIEFDMDKTLQDCLRIDIRCTGKDQKRDSLVVQDVLVADKAIVLDSITVNGVAIQHEIYLFPYVTQDGVKIYRTAYFGFNGTYTLQVEPDLITWLNQCKDQLSLTPAVSDYEQFLREIMQ